MLTTSVERLEGSQAKLTITVPAADVDSWVDRAYKEAAKKYRFPGFRPGKAPKPVLEQQLGRNNILADATENMVNDSYGKAIDAEKLRPIESPELEELDLVEPGQDYTFVATVELRPELTLSDYDAFEISLPATGVTDEELSSELDAGRERYATLEPVEDRGIEANDFALISFVGTVNGESYEGNTVDQYLYEMGRGLMPPEFDEGIVGAKAGDERHVEFTIPDTSSNEEFVGKTAEFDITVHEVKAKVLPPLDDEFAANYGFDTVDLLKEDLKTRMGMQKEGAISRLREDKIRAALAEKLEGTVPEAMVTTRQGQIMRDFLNNLEQRQMTVEAYTQMTGVTMDQIEADIKEQAVKSVAEELALEAFARGKNFEITDEDIDKEVAIMGSPDGTADPVETRARWEELGLMPVIFEQISQTKAMHWLIENVTVVEDAQDGSESGTKKETAKKASRSKKKKAEEPVAEDTAVDTTADTTEE